MSTLHDRLAELADDASPAPGEARDPGNLWDRGRRYGRRRRGAAAALVVAVLLVLAAGAGSWWQVRPAGIDPAGGPASLRLPERLYTPSGWTPGTDGTGPVGPLVAVVGAERSGWTGSGFGLAGVTGSGEYAFLDLPGWRDDVSLDGETVALSPDGRRLAYWYAEPGEDEDVDVASGVAVYDTVTGKTVRHDVEAPLGVTPQSLGWSGETLWVPVWEHENAPDLGSSVSRFHHVLRWDVGSGEAVEDGPRALLSLDGATTWGDRLVVQRGRTVRSVTADGEVTSLARLVGRTDGGAVAVSPGGTRLATLGDADPRGESSVRPQQVVVAPVPARSGADVRPAPVGSEPVDAIVGWRDDEHVVTLRYASTGAVYETVDVRTGEHRELVRLPAENVSPGTLVAAEALRAPLVDAPSPPERLDPRLVAAGGVGLALLVGVVALRLWRRRVQP
ncbi:hypothetical protein [Nocardioides dongkuii]|uniref:hypothetical protein n=1 Tax=Nocardioides dongkuii TaxID=2760089 RepID=UPI0015F9C9C0|nr:hypothetical protein [Nocardioides dongkuii]